MRLAPSPSRLPRSTRSSLSVRAWIATALGAALLLGCTIEDTPGKKPAAGAKAGAAGSYAPQSVARVLKVSLDSLRPGITARTADANRPSWVTPERWKHVRDLYTSYGNAPLWLQEGGVAERATALLDAIRNAPDQGLDTASYPVSALERVVNAQRLTDTASAGTLADADVLLTSAYVAYAADMLAGQTDPRKTSKGWNLPTDIKVLDSAVARGLQSGDMKQALAAMAPQDSDYMTLQVAYARYRRIAAAGGWQPVPAAPGPARTAALEARLRAESDSAGAPPTVSPTSPGAADSMASSARGSSDSSRADSSRARRDSMASDTSVAADSGAAATRQRKTGKTTSKTAGKAAGQVAGKASAANKKLSAANAAALASALSPQLTTQLTQFQDRHGLAPNGKLDAPTLAALNVPADERARQIATNLERHRWLPRALGSRYVYVNVPAFRLDAYDSGQKTLSMKVVVGAEYEGKVTPAFSDTMESVVFRPYWNITPDIQKQELAPKIAADRGYLARQNMEYYKDGKQTRIRQKPGPKNSLGLVKFLFPNDYNIYLHDTPDKALFAQANRAASHGCIRLEKPAELAQWVLGWAPARVQQAMNSGPDNTAVRVPQKIPVYIVYFTVYLRDGQLYFGNDIYGRDTTGTQTTAGVATGDAR